MSRDDAARQGDLHSEDRQRADTLELLWKSPELAHRVFFRHRHRDATPAFHRDMVALWHSPHPRAIFEAFRGGGKSTVSEEAIILEACYRRFGNGLVIGASYERACERLQAIRHEFETNPYLEDMFGNLVGPVWNDGKIVLSNGIVLQALGRGMSMRGAKYLDKRPDLALVDDIETEEDARTKEARAKVVGWVMRTLLPAMDPVHRIRFCGTPMDRDDVLANLMKDPSWRSLVVPIESIDPDGNRLPSWPERFPLEKIDEIREGYRIQGQLTEYAQEYMCQAEDPTEKVFTAGIIPAVAPQVKTWEATYAMLDPARTVNAKSATTGKAVWSWVRNRLVVWEAKALTILPDEIVNQVFEIDGKYSPITIGVEEDGLNEFLLQPLRHEQVKRGYLVPFRAMKAPRGKLDFIKGLQPFFKAGEVQFAGDCEDLKQQLLSFPTGRIDVPNALAYALLMRPGAPVYEDWSERCIEAGLWPKKRGVEWLSQPWLAVNATSTHTAAALVQVRGGFTCVIKDWLRDGDPGTAYQPIWQEACLLAGKGLQPVAPLYHFRQYELIGLRAASRRAGREVRRGGEIAFGRDEVRRLLGTVHRGEMALKVMPAARWTLNGFAGGFARAQLKTGQMTADPVDGPYRTLMEGIEAFAAVYARMDPESEGERNYAFTADGRRYISSRA